MKAISVFAIVDNRAGQRPSRWSNDQLYQATSGVFNNGQHRARFDMVAALDANLNDSSGKRG